MCPSTRIVLLLFLGVCCSTAAAQLPSRQDLPAQDPPAKTAQKTKEKQDPKRLPPVVVIGRQDREGVPSVPINSIGSRDVFGPEQVRATGARDLNDLVQHLPAISARPYNGGEGAAPSFSMRGLPDDGLTEYVHVLIDGVPANPMPYGWTAFSFLPLTTERVYAMDYIRGGHAVRYSPNTVGGVLNFITQPVPDKRTFGIRTTLGSHDYSSTLLTAGDRIGDTGMLFTYVDRRGDGYRRDGAFDQQDANLKLRFETGEHSWFATSLSYMEDEHKAPGGLTQAQFAADRFGNARKENRFEGDRGLIDLVAHAGSDDQNWFEGFAYLSETRRHLRAQRPHFGVPATISDWKDHSYFAAVGARGQAESKLLGVDNTVYGGVRLHREWIPHWRLSTSTFPGGGAGTLTQDAQYWTQSVSAHIDDTFEPVDDLTVTVGARVEWIPKTVGEDKIGGWRYDDDYFTVLPGGGLAYELSDSWAVFGNYFESFRAPQVWGYASTVVNPSLKFEEGDSFELGTRFVDCRGVSGSLTGWRTTYDDFGVFFTGFYQNLGKIVAEGVDVALEWDVGESVESLRGFSVSASMTLQDSELRSGPNSGNQTPYAWKNKAAWRFGYENEEGWSASLGGVYVGDSFSDSANTAAVNANGNLGRNPSWTIWDARVEKNIVAKNNADGDGYDLRVAIGATNIFDKEWSVHSRGGFFGGGEVAGPPRQFYVSMGVTF